MLQNQFLLLYTLELSIKSSSSFGSSSVSSDNRFCTKVNGSEFGDRPWLSCFIINASLFVSNVLSLSEVVYRKRLEAAEDGAEDAFAAAAHMDDAGRDKTMNIILTEDKRFSGTALWAA